MALSPGTRLGAYEILTLLGSGGMGEVYRAHDSRLRRDVAVKVLHPAVRGDPNRLRRFEVEARAMAALKHQNVVAVHDVGTFDGQPFVVSELLEGCTLRSRLVAGPLPIKVAIRFAIQFSEGLTAAHEKGIVHRDLKPENLFITSHHQVKILDFGLSKLREEGVHTRDGATTVDSVPGTLLGTIGYMSPEQVRGEQADHRSDIFSFGVILFEMLTGVNPFRRENPIETMHAILKDDPPRLHNDRDPLLNILGNIVDRCLQKDPARRFQTARTIFSIRGAELILATHESSSDVGADMDASFGGTDTITYREPLGPRGIFILIALALAIGVVVGALLIMRMIR